MKYFFLAEGWTHGRVWELGGLWDENHWRRKPLIERLDLAIQQRHLADEAISGSKSELETLWLYRVEDAVLMIEVKPQSQNNNLAIGTVLLKRLISAEQAIEILSQAETTIFS